MESGYQVAFNWAITLAGVLGGWVLKSISTSLRDLQKVDAELAMKVHAIDVLVAGKYAERAYVDEKFDKLATALFKKLDGISDKLDGKMDKP
jgi:hypothetical protein